MKKSLDHGRDVPDSDTFDADIAWLDSHAQEVQRTFPNQYVAVVNGQVVDYDPDLECLAKRIYAKFGYTDIVMRWMGAADASVRIRSPWLVDA